MEINTHDLQYTYHQGTPFEKKVLKGITVQLKSNRSIALIGRTGSGKSTFVQLLGGLIKPTAGSIRIGDTYIDPHESKNAARLFAKVGIVFQFPEHQLFEESVWKDVGYGLKNLGYADREIKERALEALQQVGLDVSYADRSPFELSEGEKRKVAIAGVLAMNPSVLILDEPTAGLDEMGKETVRFLIHQWQKKTKGTLIYITHQMDDVADLADEVLVIDDGQIVLHADPLTLFTQHQERLIQYGLTIPQPVHFIQLLNERLHTPIELSSTRKQHIMERIIQWVKVKKQGRA